MRPQPAVYGRPGCVQCKMTLQALQAKGFHPDYCDIDEWPEVAIEMRHRGMKELPFVRYGKTVWSGFRPDIIGKLKG